MAVLGIVAEYNPFHNGHKYHLEQSKKVSRADYSVCVMSGNFIQRGEPAVVNKWARTEMALLSGIDLVLELPVVYSMASAEFFAYGAVKILDSLGIVDYLCFGSEKGIIEDMDLVAGVLCQEPEEYKTILREHLGAGRSYPAAREAALKQYLLNSGMHLEQPEELLSSSNTILGIEYLKALKKLQSSIAPMTINRISNTYNSEGLTGSISSATAVRKAIFSSPQGILSGGLEKALPPQSLEILKKEFKNGRGPISQNSYETILLNLLRRMSAEELSRLPYASEGLENRVKDFSASSGSLEEFFERLSTKRYTRTRLQRMIFSLMTGLTSALFDLFNQYGGPQYIRVLGFNKTGRELLSSAKGKASLPIIVKAANFKNSCNPLMSKMLEIEAASTDAYVLGYSNPLFRKAGQEYTQNVIRL